MTDRGALIENAFSDGISALDDGSRSRLGGGRFYRSWI
jgi:hypothetical protein